jgi:RNA recognition motif-containing protein
MDKYDLSTDGNGISGLLSVLEYQGKKSQAARRSFNNVYVKGFPKDDSFTDEHLSELFKEFGEIQSAAIMRDGHGQSKGFGFVCFADGSSAEKATTAVQRREQAIDLAEDGETHLNNNDSKSKSVQGVRLSDLYVREAKKKSQRAAEL